jgi:asparagine synthetase B (glutamine-hydrolysing)
MCGFLGAFAPKQAPWLPDEIKYLRDASSRLAHRGNTSSGERIQNHFALLHHRLAFRDLSEGNR